MLCKALIISCKGLLQNDENSCSTSGDRNNNMREVSQKYTMPCVIMKDERIQQSRAERLRDAIREDERR